MVGFLEDSYHIYDSDYYPRLARYQQFKDFQRRILVATNLFGRGMDIERVNIAFNYDMPEDSDTYLHRVGSVLVTIACQSAKSWNGFTWTALTFLIPSGCEGRQVWNERSGHHLCVRWDWRPHFEWCSGQVWGEHQRTSRGDWHLVVQWVLIFNVYRMAWKGSFTKTVNSLQKEDILLFLACSFPYNESGWRSGLLRLKMRTK